MEDLFRIGEIVGAHGIKGAVKIYPTTDDPDRFLDMESVGLAKEGQENRKLETKKIQSVSFHKNVLLMYFEGVTDRNQAELLVGKSLWVTRDEAIDLEEDEYYYQDLLGCHVTDDEGNACGTIVDILSTGSNEVLVMKDENGKEILLPFIGECVKTVDPEKKEILIHWMKGLR